MDVDANAPRTMEQRGLCGTASDADALPLHAVTTTTDMESNDVHAVACEVVSQLLCCCAVTPPGGARFAYHMHTS